MTTPTTAPTTATMTRLTSRRGRPWRSGNAILEMAIVLPMVLFVVFGAMDFGQYFYLKATFEAAARDATRVAIRTTAATGDPAAAATATLAGANVTFNPAWMTVYDIYTPGADCSQIAAGHFVQVWIQVPVGQLPNVYRPLYQLTGMGLQNGKVIYGHCTMVKE